MIELLMTLEAAMLVVAALAVCYPTIAYAANVAHSRAALALATSLVLLTVGTTIQATVGHALVQNGAFFLSTAAFATSQWLFARDFVRVRNEPAEFAFADRTGGFERADRE